jgi:hypothetical protein
VSNAKLASGAVDARAVRAGGHDTVRPTRPQAVTRPGGAVEIVPQPVNSGFHLLAQC